MAVRANLIVGAVGAVLALTSGSLIAVNWDSLAGIETWEASFKTERVRLPDRASSVAPGATRNEVHSIAHANLTTMNVDVTWSDPPFNSPELTVRVLDPSRRARVEQSHTGGASGIHLKLELVPPGDIPTGIRTFEVRSDPQDANARQEFATRWPTRDETRGDWTIEIRSTAPDGPAPSGNAVYTVQVTYEFYHGTFERRDEPVR